MSENESEFLTYREVAELLRLPMGTVYYLVSTNQIPHHRLGKRLVRFNLKDLTIWVGRKAIKNMERDGGNDER